MKKLIFIWFIAATVGTSFAQTIQATPGATVPRDVSYEIIPMDKGIFAISIDKYRQQIHYFFTDEDFNIKSTGKCDIGDISVRILHKVKEDKAYVFLNFFSPYNWQKIVMTIDSNSGEVTFIPVNNYSLSYVNDFFVLENSIAMVGYYNDNLNMVQFLNLKGADQEPYTINLDMKIFDMAESDGYLDILASPHTGKDGDKLQLITFNELGEKLYSIDAMTGFGNKERVKSGYLQKTDDGKFRAVGTYADSKRTHFSGFFYWDMDYSLDQKFTKLPASSLQGFAKSNNKKLNRQLKHEMSKGFGIVKILEEKGQLAIVSAPNIGYKYQKKYPQIFKNELFHVLHIAEDGKMIKDETIAFHRSLRSPYVDNNFIRNPPMYMVNGNVYFFYNEEFTHSPSLIVHDLKSDAKQTADQLSFTVPHTAYLYKTIKYKENEIIVYGMKNSYPTDDNFFMGKIHLD